MGEAVVRTLYWLSKWVDETSPHEPTLPAAAEFLRDGCSEFWPVANGAPGTPLATDGETVEVHTLDLFANRVAIRVEDDLGEGWSLTPPPPPEADFFAIRYGHDGGWDAECIAGSLDGLRDILEADDHGAIIAVGRHGSARAMFSLAEDGSARLELVVPAVGPGGPGEG